MAGLEDALANQAIINRGDRWIDSMRSRQSEVDYKSSVYKRFGYEIDEARRMQEECARRQLVEEARKKREEELTERSRHETLERALDRITKDAKMMDAVGTGKDIPLTKMTIMQGITSGKGIDINEIIQAKQTEKLLKDLDSGKELTIGKLLTYQALTQGDGFDLNALIQAKFVEKLFDEDEKTDK